jgi:hypothetical protein
MGPQAFVSSGYTVVNLDKLKRWVKSNDRKRITS